MQIEIEAPVPYEQSRLWSLHREYYQQQGVKAFLGQDVPYNISSNPCLARQLVGLLQAAWAGRPRQPVRILEVGGGLGMLAYNLLRVLAQEAPEWYGQVEYWLSDYAATTLRELAKHPDFAALCASGRLRLCLLDGEQPQQAQDLDGLPLALPASGFDLVMANYFFSTLPTAVLLRQHDQWLRQLTRLDWLPLGAAPQASEQAEFCAALADQLRSYRLIDQIKPEHPDRRLFEALMVAQQEMADQLERDLPLEGDVQGDFRDWFEAELAERWARQLGNIEALSLRPSVGALLGEPLLTRKNYPPELIRETHSFAPAEATELFASEVHAQAIESLTAGWPQVSLGYSAKALKALDGLVKLTCPHGLVVISDKAYAGPEWMRGLEPERATRHGQSLAHPVNFPLFEAVLAIEGLATRRTAGPAQALHSLLIYAGPELPEALAQQFQADFIDDPRNEISHALLEGGHALMQAERLEQASRALLRALSYRPEDGTLQYLAAVCLLNQERYAEALALLEAPHDDLFGLFNREILLAEIYRLTSQPAKALPLYLRSLRHGENSQTFYNLALCQVDLDQLEDARLSLQRAAELDPDDAEIQSLLANLSAD